MLQGVGACRRVVRVEYMVHLEVCGADLMVNGDAAAAGGWEEGEGFCGRQDESEKRDDSTATVDRTLSASSKPFRQVPSGVPSTKSNADGANTSSDAVETRRGALQPRRNSSDRLRLTIPRIAVRACSPVVGDAEVVVGPRLCPGGSCGAESKAKTAADASDVSSSSGGVISGGGLPSITVAAEWLEGHLEMDDPGCTPFALPQKQHALFGGLPSIGVVDRAPSPVLNRSVAPAWQEDAHRLRWLSVRKVSFGVGPTGLAETGGDGCRPALDVDGGVEVVVDDGGGALDANEGGSVESGDGSRVAAASTLGRLESGDEAQQTKLAKLAKQAKQGQVGVKVDGVWAEWSPPLFFLAGKAGAMVSVA